MPFLPSGRWRKERGCRVPWRVFTLRVPLQCTGYALARPCGCTHTQVCTNTHPGLSGSLLCACCWVSAFQPVVYQAQKGCSAAVILLDSGPQTAEKAAQAAALLRGHVCPVPAPARVVSITRPATIQTWAEGSPGPKRAK